MNETLDMTYNPDFQFHQIFFVRVKPVKCILCLKKKQRFHSNLTCASISIGSNYFSTFFLKENFFADLTDIQWEKI